MAIDSSTFIDTDIQIHRLSPDVDAKNAVKEEIDNAEYTAMSAFSLLELKGNYIQALILLRRKIADGKNIGDVMARINNTGGRKVTLMFLQLANKIGRIDFNSKPWEENRQILLTLLDSQIASSWMIFTGVVDYVCDDFDCTRASEEPEFVSNKWFAPIPKCRKDNTNCSIIEFIEVRKDDLARLIDLLGKIPKEEITSELQRIKNVCEETLRDGAFPQEKNVCRQVGDMLIGLQSKIGKEILSSNYKEHSYLSEGLGYNFRQFPYADVRSK